MAAIKAKPKTAEAFGHNFASLVTCGFPIDVN